MAHHAWLLRAARAAMRAPARQSRHLGHSAGVVLALPAAVLITAEAAHTTPIDCSAGVGCALLTSMTEAEAVLLGAALLTGMILGVLTLERRRGAAVQLLTALVVTVLPLLPAAALSWQEPAAGLLLVPVGLAAIVGAQALLWLPAPLVRSLLTALSQHQRRWWQSSLRAARLTRRTLGAGAYAELCRRGHVRVQSSLHPARVYLVPRRTSPAGARVLVEEHHRVVGGLCLRPRTPLPDPEEVVAHVLLLRSDERAYLRAANFFPYDRELSPQATARRL